MAWLAIYLDGTEYLYSDCPERAKYWWQQVSEGAIKLPSGSIEKLIGRKLAWDDEPVELKS